MEKIEMMNDTTWLHHVKQIETWLESPHLKLPENGTKESQLQRGHEYPSIRTKCWTHLLNEIQDLSHGRPEFLDEVPEEQVEKEVPEAEAEAPMSPNRGSIRPGKTLLSPALEPKIQTSMAERQAQWLAKKQRKVDAERSRQLEEQEKELTFRPDVRSPTSGVYASVRAKVNQQPTPPDALSNSNQQHAQARRNSLDARPASQFRKKIVRRKSTAPASSLLETIRSELRASAETVAHSTGSDAESIEEDRANVSPSTDEARANVSPSTDEDTVIQSTQDTVEDLEPVPEKPRVTTFKYNLACSTELKGRHNVRDASLFEINSFYRKRDKYAGRPGITLQVGRREDTHVEQVVAILFDTAKMSELEAGEWWAENQHRFVD